MTPDLKNHLVETVVRPFSEDAELTHAAADFLAKRLVGDARTADAMKARWDEVDSRKRSPLRPCFVWAVVAVVSASVAHTDFEEISRLIPWGKWIATGSIIEPLPAGRESMIANKLSQSDKLLLFGDLSKKTKAERKEALWRSEPENPAYFADYSVAFISENSGLPPDFLKTARRIDPGNAWFTYLAATVEAKDAVDSGFHSSTRVAGKMVSGPKSWKIRDPARLDRVMALLVEARNQPKCMDYSTTMLKKRIPLLSEVTFLDQLDSGACLAEVSTFSSLRLLNLAKAIAAIAWSSGASGDAAKFEEISNDADRLIRGIRNEEIGPIVDEMGRNIAISTLVESLASAAEALRLEPDVGRWKPIDKRMKDASERRRSQEFIVDGKAVKRDTVTGGIFSGGIEMIATRVENQIPLTDADLKPMRLVDHEILSWMLSYVLWIAMALCLCFVACYRFRVSVMSRRLARRMTDLLRPSDWGWIIGGGFALPFLFVMAVNRLTPLGGREFGALGMALLMPASQFFGLLILWLILPAQIVSWRLAKRADGFGFPLPSPVGWLAVLTGTAFVPMIGWAAISGVGGFWIEALKFDPMRAPAMPWMFWTALSLAVVPLLWVVAVVSLAMFGQAQRHLYRSTVSLVLVRAYPLALLILALGSIGFKASERHWFEQDWMTKFDTSGPGWSAYESKVAMQMRKELREALGDGQGTKKN